MNKKLKVVLLIMLYALFLLIIQPSYGFIMLLRGILLTAVVFVLHYNFSESVKNKAFPFKNMAVILLLSYALLFIEDSFASLLVGWTGIGNHFVVALAASSILLFGVYLQCVCRVLEKCWLDIRTKKAFLCVVVMTIIYLLANKINLIIAQSMTDTLDIMLSDDTVLGFLDLLLPDTSIKWVSFMVEILITVQMCVVISLFLSSKMEMKDEKDKAL